MNKRKLGNTNLHVAPIAFGGNVLGWTANEKMSFEILDAFTAAGFNLIDTADVYSRWGGGVGGESETIIGKWHKKHNNRDKIIIASKGGMDMGQGKTDVTKKYLIKAAEDSLKRLQTDHIDLYQTHKDDEATPVEEALEAYAQLIKEGKIRYVGASNFSPARFSEALEASKKNGLPCYETLQPLYNLCEREVFEKELESLCVKNNISVLNYFALGVGFLTGKYRSEADLSKSVRGDRVKKYINPKGFGILKALDDVAAQHKSTCASIAIAWLLHRPSVTAPIASATNLQQLDSLIRSVDIKLSKEQIALLDEASKW
ncbi:MAG TPA: aldo/keto reductase [Bacteroidia bacterium]|nr:aldo/keto reductase [Bacteroidia bacterium]